METKLKQRGLLSTALISFFLTSFAGFLWIGRGFAALIALAVMMLLAGIAFYLAGFAAFTDDASLTGIGDETVGGLIDFLLIGLIHVAVVLSFRRPARPARWYSSGFVVLGLALVLPLLAAAVVRTFAYQPFSIPSSSMAPALVEGDYLWVSKSAYGYSRHSAPFGLLPVPGRIFAREPERGDIVVFKFPPNTSIDYTKRVVGLPGERIQMMDGVLHIDGKPVDLQRKAGVYSDPGWDREAEVQIETLPNGAKYRVLSLADDGLGDNTREFVVPEGHYFMLGDNRDNSTDSRFNVGFVPFDLLVGRAVTIYANTEGREFESRADLGPGR